MSVLKFPVLSSTSLSGARYVSPNGIIYTWDGFSWRSGGAGAPVNPIRNNPFLYRTIYTRGYTSCGYQSSSPWRNVNRTVHATDVSTNLGDLIDYVTCYNGGGFSDYNAYVFNDGNAWAPNSNITSSMSMITETNRTISTSRYTTVSRNNLAGLMNPGLTIIYVAGGGSVKTDKYSTVTDCILAADSTGDCPTSGGWNGGVTAFYGQYYGIVGNDGSSGSLSWSSETWTSGTWSWSSNTNGQPKGLSSKWGYAYSAAGSWAGSSTYYKFNDTTGSNISSFGRPESCGEENAQTGQDWGYTLGSYNGVAQTNNSTKTSYITDSCVALGSDGQPKGHGGMSSGCCATGSVTLLGGVMGESI